MKGEKKIIRKTIELVAVAHLPHTLDHGHGTSMAQHGRPSLVYTKQVLVLPVTDCLPARPGLNDLNLSREVITTIHFARDCGEAGDERFGSWIG